MFPFLKKQISQQPVLVVDIGNGSVAAAVVVPGTHDTPARVRTYQRVPLKQTEERRTHEQIIAGVADLITPTVTGVVQAYGARSGASISRILAVLHTPWTQSVTSEAVHTYESEVHITQTHVSAAAKEAAQKAVVAAGEVFEKAVVRIEVNGYPTPRPEGKRGVSLRTVVIQTAADQALLNTFRTGLGAALPGREVTFRSATHMLMTTLEPMSRRVPNYTIVDVTSEATSMSIVRDGILQGEHTADIGWRALIRVLAQKYSTTPEEAISRFRMALAESCTDQHCSDVIASLSDAVPLFVTPYGQMCATLSKTERLPTAIVLVAPPDIAPWFVELFGRIDFAPFTDTGQPFYTQQLLSQHLADMVIFEPGLVPEAGIAADAVFVHMESVHT